MQEQQLHIGIAPLALCLLDIQDIAYQQESSTSTNMTSYIRCRAYKFLAVRAQNILSMAATESHLMLMRKIDICYTHMPGSSQLSYSNKETSPEAPAAPASASFPGHQGADIVLVIMIYCPASITLPLVSHPHPTAQAAQSPR